MAQFEELTIATPSLRLAARAHGPDDAPVVIALHGWLDNAASFDAVAPLLSGLRVVAIDLPGHGHSERLPAAAPYMFLDQVAHVHAAIEALALARFVLLGHSLGAAIAATLAGTMLDRVAALAVIEGLGPVTEPATEQAARFAKALAEETAKAGRVPPVHASVAAAVQRLAKATGMPVEAAEIIATRGLAPVEGGFQWRSDPRLRLPSRQRLSEDVVRSFLARIACPVLIVRGTTGSPFAPRAGSERLTALRDVRLVECPGGHHVHLQSPREVADAVGPFLREHARDGSP